MRCQFTFACDGIRDRITEPDAWDRAKEIARETLDGKLWLADVGKATHYHAYWVHPSWVREMARLYKIGVHTFYRPRNWGDGSDAPTWAIPPRPRKRKASYRTRHRLRRGPDLLHDVKQPAGANAPRGFFWLSGAFANHRGGTLTTDPLRAARDGRIVAPADPLNLPGITILMRGEIYLNNFRYLDDTCRHTAPAGSR
jgi:hypothetical protein